MPLQSARGFTQGQLCTLYNHTQNTQFEIGEVYTFKETLCHMLHSIITIQESGPEHTLKTFLTTVFPKLWAMAHQEAVETK